MRCEASQPKKEVTADKSKFCQSKIDNKADMIAAVILVQKISAMPDIGLPNIPIP